MSATLQNTAGPAAAALGAGGWAVAVSRPHELWLWMNGVSLMAMTIFLVQSIMLSVAAAYAAGHARATGTGDLLRLTNLNAKAIVDGYMARTALQAPAWLLGIPLVMLAAIGAALWVTECGSVAVGCAPQPDPAWTPIYRMISFGIAECMAIPASLALGLASGLLQPTRRAAMLAAAVGTVVLQWVVSFGAALVVDWLWVEPLMYLADADAFDRYTAALRVYDACSQALLIIYWIALFLGARRLAAQRIERAE